MKILLVTLVVGYVGVLGLVYATQRKLLFPSPAHRDPTPPGARVVDVPSGTHFLWSEVPGSGPVVVHFHGNAEQIANQGWMAAWLKEQGVSFASVEYPGYPGASGAASEASLTEAAERALEHLTGPMGISRERLVLSGQSVGTGVAVAMAAKGWGTRVLLVSPYTSLPEVARRLLPWAPVGVLMRDTFDSATRAGSLQQPVLVLHGTDDEVIAFELGRELAARFAHARLVPLAGAHHNDVWSVALARHEALGFVLGN